MVLVPLMNCVGMHFNNYLTYTKPEEYLENSENSKKKKMSYYLSLCLSELALGLKMIHGMMSE